MRIMLANQYLQPVADLLAATPLRAAQSRARSKLLTLVKQALARFGEDEYELVAEYAARDENGAPLLDSDGTFRLADPEKAGEFMTARTRLLESLAEVSGPTYDTHLVDLKALLDGYDGELSGEAAEAYDVLYDAIEAASGKEQQ
ncbi:DUF1617 family protein [Cutibacterium avidum]|uniref:DUF1617 family protein n=1 Tax=Cutibacterium avidum TaxID=33010 RepID=UPI0008F5B938|nr:DUF1617 family protein [Cutibacterium avidum]MDK7699073.1 DUF1617 family protein [Cutibacterium avidum]OIJ75723.1 hypothetical protein APY06_03050 [Cutibacterium avidum]